jgi:hypothetical protein
MVDLVKEGEGDEIAEDDSDTEQYNLIQQSSINKVDVTAQSGLVGVDRLAYHVYQDVFNDFFPDKQQLKSLMITYKNFQREIQGFLEAA